jgi:hypothetical protein
MDRFNCRSPYIISVDGDAAQVGTKIFLEVTDQLDTSYILNKTIEKKMFSPTQRINHYNISPYIYDLLNTFEEYQYGCIIYLTKYYTLDGINYIQIGDYISLISTNGYSDYDNQNNTQNSDCIVLAVTATSVINYDRNLNYPTIDVIFDFRDNTKTYYVNLRNGDYNETTTITNTYLDFRRFNMTSITGDFDNDNYFEIYSLNGDEYQLIYQVKLVNLCEIKYNPIKLDYVNRLGGKQSMYFFKNSNQTIEVKGSDYNTNTFDGYPVYNTTLGQKRIYNKNGSKTIKCNSGWLNEAENINIQDIMLSENLLLTYDENGATVTKAVTLKNSSQLFKTHLNEKVINYELEFEVASQLINNVV